MERAPRRHRRAPAAERILALAVAALAVAACARSSGTAPASPSTPAVPPVPDDPFFPAQWHLRMIGIPEAWQVTTGAGAVVAVLDTGVAYEDEGPYRRAPDLAGTRFVPGWDFIDDDSHPNDEAVSGRPGHGTHMAGTIAQTTGNQLGGAGVAPGAAIMPIRVVRTGGEGAGAEEVAQGLRFAADHGAHVANVSLASRVDAPEVAAAVRYAVDKGVTVVAPIGEDGGSDATFPAAYPGVVAVGAVRMDRSRAAYSNFGPRLDLVAPGGDLSGDRDGDGLEDGIVQQTVLDQRDTFCFCFIEGTSSAAAHVSGTAALVVAAGRAVRPADVRAALLDSAEDLGPPGRDDEFGAGLVSASRAVRPPGGRS
ncbi:MAG TPA: S8 family serine peptidase [Acidimicrobiales bacterium]|nr:S8 family serine peptidase [Acidimicrobiales bacterium]